MKIVIWTGPAWETWGAKSLETGIGGSEAAATYLSRELAELGHEVEVVGQVWPSEHYYGHGSGSVKFVDHREYAEYGRTLGPDDGRKVRDGRKLECDVFVSSRYLPIVDTVHPDARLKVLWMHDIHGGPDYYHHMKAYDAVFCLSRWALDICRKFYPHMPPERFVQTRNGICGKLFEGEPCKQGWKVVYSSSADRGLDRLLDFWPSIRMLRPDAELHVYYGFETWERMAVHNCDDVSVAQIQIFRTRLQNMADQGVTLHGRVGQAELAKAWMGARAWLYPTNFSETSCITAMEAQAAGAYCVCSRLAALAETARFAQFVDPPNDREGYRQEFLRCVEGVCRMTESYSGVTEGRQWALRELDWSGVARQWEEIFRTRMGI